jgi:hypothetical protein
MKQGHGSFKKDPTKRAARRATKHTIKRTHGLRGEDEEGVLALCEVEKESSQELAEARMIVSEMARSFISTIEFYKAEHGGKFPHDEAVKKTLEMHETRRGWVEGEPPERVSWGEIAAVGERNMGDALKLWTRIRDAADDELESGRRMAKVAGLNSEPFAVAQFFAIRDAFADQWEPKGGIESAMIDMLTVSFSLQMYWSEIAHTRALREHDEQRKAVGRFESSGWKSPYQSMADAIDQAHRLADSYNRQFMRVLRQMRDLRRYAPPVIVNNGGQVNVANQQVNVTKTD